MNKLTRLFVLALAAMTITVSSAWAAYTDKSYHESGETHTYKHPKQRSFTGPFDYGAKQEPRVAPTPKPPTGRCNCFTFDSTKSYDVDGQKLSVTWDFGDGQTSDQPVVQHCYEKAGDYKVTLTVKDSSGMVCDSGVTTTTVTANYPPTAVAGEDMKVCVGESATFDASGSTTSGPSTYKWDFGDGQTAEGMKVSHAYEKAGNYRVALWIDDGKGTECSTAQDTVSVWVADAVSVSVKGPETACAGKNVNFEAMGKGVSKYWWDFGDGSTWEGGSRASHTYAKSGAYTVTVTADNGQGFACSKASDSASIKVNGAPIADAGENLACCVGESVTFDASGSSDPDDDPITCAWNFGDGNTAEGIKVNHTYAKSGTYRVVLTVSDNSGSECGTATDSFVANVNTKPEAVIEVR